MDVEDDAAMPDDPAPVGPCWRCGADATGGARFKKRFACRQHEPELHRAIVIPATRGSGRHLDLTPMRVALDDVPAAEGI